MHVNDRSGPAVRTGKRNPAVLEDSPAEKIRPERLPRGFSSEKNLSAPPAARGDVTGSSG